MRAVDDGADGARQRGLAGAGGVLEQEVASREHRRERESHGLALVQDRHGHAVDEALEDLGEPGCILNG